MKGNAASKSPTIQDAALTSTVLNEPETSQDRQKNNGKISERVRKKSWYNVIYPSYKTRSQTFKKLFKDVPNDERLVVDYSCALQREILMHGRLFVTQNYLCFHANIFGWETYLSLKLREITAITKDKTARFIPNAILLSTENEKYFLTSFATRNKAYLMLFRVWQNALMNKPMTPQEMWQWVHNCYGDQLGLTSDDEDYIDPNENRCEKELHNRKHAEKKNEISSTIIDKKFRKSEFSKGLNTMKKSDGTVNDKKLPESDLNIVSDLTDSSDSENSYTCSAKCTSLHEGRQLVQTILPINVDNLMLLLFSKSQFLEDFHINRKTTNMVFNDWIVNDAGIKIRTINLTIALTQPVGPKCSHVTELQVMRECSLPGHLYSIDVNSTNLGVPYADSFYVVLHYCLLRTIDNQTMISVYAQIKYSKSVWGVVKTFIEKNTWAGLEDFFSALIKALQKEYCMPLAKSRSRRKKTRAVTQNILSKDSGLDVKKIEKKDRNITYNRSSLRVEMKSVKLSDEFKINTAILHELPLYFIVFLVFILLVNIVLVVKLFFVKQQEFAYLHNQQVLSSLFSNISGKWLEKLEYQENLYNKQISDWDDTVQSVIALIRKVEEAAIQLAATATYENI